MYWLNRLFYRARNNTRVRTVKNTFSLAAIAVLSLMATALLSTEQPYIRLETPDTQVAAGETFPVTVFAGAPEAVNAIDIIVSFPRNSVTVEGIDTGNSVISLWTQDPYVEGNKVILQGGTFRRGFVGEHQIARINVTAIEAGTAEFMVTESTLVAGDGEGNLVENIADTPVLVVAVNDDGVLSGEATVTFTTDINGDGSVSFSDVNQFMTAWRNGEWIYDFNQDNRMNFTDFAIILADSFFQ